LQGRLWMSCYRDDHVGVYACVRAKNLKKNTVRIDLRCERVLDGSSSDPSASVADVVWQLPAGVTAQEADGAGTLTLAQGPLQERSAKVKCTLSLAPFLAPKLCQLAGELRYSLAASGADAAPCTGALDLKLPATTFLAPAQMSEDDVAEYVHASELLGQQSAQVVSFALPGRSLAAVAESLPRLVGRCAGLTNLYGIQNQLPPGGELKSQKFLLVARPPGRGASQLPGQESLPDGALIICLCAGLPKDGAMDIRVTCKSCQKQVSDDILAQLANLFRELVEGRLCEAAS